MSNQNQNQNQNQYKVTVAEAATKGARLDNGGATARSWCVIRIDPATGEKRTAAQIIVTAAVRATDKNAARKVKDMSRAFGGVYARRTAAILAAARAVDLWGDCYLDKRLDLDEAKSEEEVYIEAAAARKEAARARRLERMTPEERKAAEDRAAIKAIKARAAAEIAALKGTAR